MSSLSFEVHFQFLLKSNIALLNGIQEVQNISKRILNIFKNQRFENTDFPSKFDHDQHFDSSCIYIELPWKI